MPLPLWSDSIVDNAGLNKHLSALKVAVEEIGDSTTITERKSILKVIEKQSQHFFPCPFKKGTFLMSDDEKKAELANSASIFECVFQLSELLAGRFGIDNFPVQLASNLYVMHLVIPLARHNTGTHKCESLKIQNALKWFLLSEQNEQLVTNTACALQRLLHSNGDKEVELSISKRVCGVLQREFERVGESVANRAPWLIAAFWNVFHSDWLKREWTTADLALAVAARCLDECDENFKLLGVAFFDCLLLDAAAHAPNTCVRLADLCSMGYADVIFNALVQLIPKINSSFEQEHCATLLCAATDSLLRCILVFETETNPQIMFELLGATSTDWSAKPAQTRTESDQNKNTNTSSISMPNRVALLNAKAKRNFEKAFGELLSNLFFETNIEQTQCVAGCVERLVDRFGANCMPLGNELIDTVACALKTSAKVGANARLTVALLRVLVAFVRRCSFAARYVYANKLVAILFELLIQNEALLKLERAGEQFELTPGRRRDPSRVQALEQVEQASFECFDCLLGEDEDEKALAGRNCVQQVLHKLTEAGEFEQMINQYSSVRHVVARLSQRATT